MENDLISRSDAEKHLVSLTSMFTDELGFAISLVSAVGKIRGIPAVDAEPVRYGRWEHYKTMHNIVCSVCKSHRPYKKTERGYHVVWNANYCPNCGTKMEEDAN